MEEKKKARWRKLDNAALAFPAVTDKKDSRVFRFYCQLQEPVKEECLQQALDKTVEKYPVFQAVMRKGLFWFYLENRDIRAIAKQEVKKPCSHLYVPDAKSLLFEVTYYKDRINLEVFHSLSDGTGAIQFLKELVKNYLVIAHKDDGLEDIPVSDDNETNADHEEDSFSQYYSPDLPRSDKKGPKAYQLSGPKFERSDFNVTEYVMPVSQVLKAAKSYGVSMTVLLTSVLLCAIHEEMTIYQQRRPVTLMIPVNLRKFFPSSSMTNFWGWLEAGYKFNGEADFKDVLMAVKQYFEKELVKERVAMRMTDYIRLEKNPVLRAVPLEIKNLVMHAATRLRAQNITAVLSNVGVIQMPKPYEPYIRRFGVFSNTDKMQLCICSYKDELVLGFASKLVSPNIERNVFRMLTEMGIECEHSENVFPKQKEDDIYVGKKVYQWFSFSLVMAAVLSIMVNLMVTPNIIWSPFACGAAGCLWLCGTLGYMKRRNLLKNLMWQLVAANACCFLWDAVTGWRGWAMNYVFPLSTVAVLAIMLIFSKAKKLETAEYLIYFIMVSVIGLVPALLYVIGKIQVVYPAIICGGLCFLSLARIIIFKFRDFQTELGKKFRM